MLCPKVSKGTRTEDVVSTEDIVDRGVTRLPVGLGRQSGESTEMSPHDSQSEETTGQRGP